MIAADGIDVAYGTTAALTGVSLVAPAATVVGLIGPNGSGKTTLLRTLYASLIPTAGRVAIDGTDIARMRRVEIARSIAVVAQDADGDLPVTVAEMVLLGRIAHRRPLERFGSDDRRTAAAALRRVGARHLAARPFASLSGGERQRVLIARALAQEAGHLLLDEPTNHLDIRFQHEVLELVRSLRLATVVVLHDLNLAARYCDRLVLLDHGRVVAAGSPMAVLDPAVLTPVYEVEVRRRIDDGIHLTFRSLARLEEHRLAG